MIDEKGKRHSTPERGIPPHMLEDPLNEPQKKAFAKARKAADETDDAPKQRAKKAPRTKRAPKAEPASKASEE